MNKLNVATLLSALLISGTAIDANATCLLNSEGAVIISGEYFVWDSNAASNPTSQIGLMSISQAGSAFAANYTPGTINGTTVTLTSTSATGVLSNSCTQITWSSTFKWVKK